MKIEWWLLDGIVGLVILIAVTKGMARGIGDSVFRLIGTAGGLVGGVVFSDKLSEFLNGTKIHDLLYTHILNLVMSSMGLSEPVAAEGEQTSGEIVNDMLVNNGTGDGAALQESLPKTIGGIVAEAAKETAEAAAERLTEVAVSILGFVLIMIAIGLVMAIIRSIYKYGRRNLPVIGFFDRMLGGMLGLIQGGLLACLVVAAIVPVVTLFWPDKLAEVIDAIHASRLTGVIYDINPIGILIQRFI